MSLAARFFLLKCAMILFVLNISLPAHAAGQSPQTFTLDGQLLQAGTDNPLLDTNAKIKVQILNPSKTCVLYEEEQTVNTATSNGYYNIAVGSIIGAPKRTYNDPGLTMIEIYQNLSPVVASSTTPSSCSGSTYTPAAYDVRYFRLVVTPSATNVPDTLSPDTVMDSVPTALVAETLQGMAPAQFLQTGTGDLTQTNLQSIFSTGNSTKLTSLLSVNPSNYVLKDATNGTIRVPAATTPSNPLAGQIWYDTGTIKYWDGVAERALNPWLVTGADLSFMGGKVGIGTTTPGNQLDVIGNAYVSSALTAGALYAYNIGGYQSSVSFGGTQNYWVKLTTVDMNYQYMHYENQITLTSRRGLDAKLTFIVRQEDVLGVAPEVEVHLDSANSKLLKADVKAVTTINDASKTQVELYIRTTQDYEVVGYQVISQSGYYDTVDSEPGTLIATLPAGTQTSPSYGSALWSISSGANITFPGNVGIGTTASNQVLNLYNGGSTYINIQAGPSSQTFLGNDITGATFFPFSAANDTNLRGSFGLNIGSLGAKPIKFATNNAARMTIDSNGKVGIGTTAPSGVFEVTSTTGGVVLPRMTKAQRNAIASPIAGTMVYQTDSTPGLRVYNGTNWMRFTETADP